MASLPTLAQESSSSCWSDVRIEPVRDALWIMQVHPKEEALVCGAFAEPSDGLEPSTPSYHRAMRREARASAGLSDHESPARRLSHKPRFLTGFVVRGGKDDSVSVLALDRR